MSKQRLEKRRVLLFLPLLVLPFLAFGFYALDGGDGVAQGSQARPEGINAVLPDAQFKTAKPEDKMSIYNAAQKDSAGGTDLSSIAGKLGFNPEPDAQTQQINEKLAAINKEISTPYVAPKPAAYPPGIKSPGSPDAGMAKDVAKLEALMNSLKIDGTEDPEMAQLSAVLQKIQEIQNPEIVKAKQPLADQGMPDSLFQAIPAVIDGDQKAVQGSVVRLKLLDTITVNGQLIPKGHLVYGLGSFSNQRLNLEIKNIRLGNSIVPVNLTVFDRGDAMSGINAPEAMLADAVSSGGADAISGIGISGFDLSTQLAGAGLDAAKSLLTKKLKKVKQPLKSGYQLLLRDNTKKKK